MVEKVSHAVRSKKIKKNTTGPYMLKACMFLMFCAVLSIYIEESEPQHSVPSHLRRRGRMGQPRRGGHPCLVEKVAQVTLSTTRTQRGLACWRLVCLSCPALCFLLYIERRRRAIWKRVVTLVWWRRWPRWSFPQQENKGPFLIEGVPMSNAARGAF